MLALLLALQVDVSLEEKRLAVTGPIHESEGVFAVFAPDGRSVAFTEKLKSGKARVVHGETKSEEFDGIRVMGFAPDGKTLMFVASVGGKQCVVIDGKRGDLADEVSPPMFDATGTAVYTVKRDGAMSVVVGEKAGEAYAGVADLTVSRDRKSIAYRAWNKANEEYVVVGDEKRGPYHSASGPAFSPDGRVLYVARKEIDKKIERFMVIGKEETPNEGILDTPVVSPDGKTIAYRAAELKPWPPKMFVVVGEKKSEISGEATRPVFSADGSSCAYWESDKKTGRYRVVVNGKAGEGYQLVLRDSTGDPVFSPDGKTVAYRVRPFEPPPAPIDKWRMIVGEKKGEAYDYVSNPVFSPDGSTLAYVAQKERKCVVVIAEEEGPEHDTIYGFAFSPDGKKIAYGARDHRELWWKVIEVK